MNSLRQLAIGSFLLFCCSACSFAPDVVRPEFTMPEVWPSALTSADGAAQGEELSVHWWKRFDDDVLNALMDEAFAHNRDLATALSRVEAAKAKLNAVRVDILPRIDGKGQANPMYYNGKQGVSFPYAASFAASWEIDLWGKYRNLAEAQKAEYLASEAAYEAGRLALAGQVATSYFTLRMLELKRLTAERTLKTREDALAIYTCRYEQGVINELDLAQARSVVETARATLHSTNALIESAEASLAAMLGRSPREIMTSHLIGGKQLEDLAVPPVIPAGLPSALLERRPDIRQAEQNILVANARVGVARAAWLPDISLTAAFGAVSAQLGDLFTSKRAESKGVGGSATIPILDFGRVYNEMKAADATLKAEYAAYEQTVLNAFADMRTALSAQSEAGKVAESVGRLVIQYRTAHELAILRYENGYSSYLDVLDAERSLFQAELELASARADRLIQIVNVCLALGGGWQGADPQ